MRSLRLTMVVPPWCIERASLRQKMGGDIDPMLVRLLDVLDEGDDERAVREEDAGYPLDDSYRLMGECLIR